MRPSGSRKPFGSFAVMLYASIAITVSTRYLRGANKSANTWEDWQNEGDRLLNAGRYGEARLKRESKTSVSHAALARHAREAAERG
jgi:hypothetical protein